MAEQIKVPGVLRPGTGDYHSYAKDIIDDQLRNKKQSELNALFNQGKGIDKNGNIVPVAGGKAIDADDISYTEKVSPDSHKTGSMGKKVKELEDRINDLVPGEEYVSDTVIDLIDYMLDENTPQSFTYDSDTKYVYGGKVTTMCTYARNNTSYAAFKVVDIDKYIVYTIYDNTFTYYNELNSETLPNEARSKFELGKYALVKQLEGKTGDSWVDGKVGVFVDSSNRPMSFRYISSVEIYGQTLNNVLLGKTADGTNIYVYNLSSGLFKFNNRISSNDSAFDALNNLIVGVSGSSGGVTDYDDLDNKPIIKTANNGYGVVSTDYENSGAKAFAEGDATLAAGEASHAEGKRNVAVGNYSHAEGIDTIAFGNGAHSEGEETTAIRDDSHVEGKGIISSDVLVLLDYTANDSYIVLQNSVTDNCALQFITDDNKFYCQCIEKCSYDNQLRGYKATLYFPFSVNIAANTSLKVRRGGAMGTCSHAEGYITTAVAAYSHAEGKGSRALGESSHAEGNSVASGWCAHAEGNSTTSNDFAHAEGAECIASGKQSHAEGYYTETKNKAEHAEGKYNLSTLNKTLSSIGFGNENARKNAFEVDVNGNVYIYGIGNYDGTNISASNIKSVQTVIAELVAALTQ